MARGTRYSTLSAWLSLAVFGSAVALSQISDAPPGLTLSCANLSCGGSVNCGYAATVSCCRNGTAAFSCTCCDTNFDCVNPPSGWNCNDTQQGGH